MRKKSIWPKTTYFERYNDSHFKIKLACFACRKVFKKIPPERWAEEERLYELRVRCSACRAVNPWDEEQSDHPCQTCGKEMGELGDLEDWYVVVPETGNWLKCPQCSGELIFVGQYFKAPKQSDKKAWAIAEKLVKAGFLYEFGWKYPGSYRPSRQYELESFFDQGWQTPGKKLLKKFEKRRGKKKNHTRK